MVTNVIVIILALYIIYNPYIVVVAIIKWSPSLSHPQCWSPEGFAIFPLKIQTIQREKQPLDSHFPEKVTTILDFLLCPPPTVFHKLNQIKLAVSPFASLAQNQWVHPTLSFRMAVLLGGIVIYFTFFDQYMRCCFCFFFFFLPL